MSEKKLTPAEAWEHVKALWPDACALTKDAYGNSTLHRTEKQFLLLGDCAEWPEGMDRYPPIAKPRRPARMPEDFGKPAWFRDSIHDHWTKGELCGLTKSPFEHWVDEDGNQWLYADVECDELKPAKVQFDEPEGEPEPEWITPTEEHIGKIVEVRDFENELWRREKLRSVSYRKEFPFEAGMHWKFARIRNPKYKG
jgi:hypothetical protein